MTTSFAFLTLVLEMLSGTNTRVIGETYTFIGENYT